MFNFHIVLRVIYHCFMLLPPRVGWERHGLKVDYNWNISSKEAHERIADGSVEFVDGNHVSTYAKRTQGDLWVYLGQTVNLVDHRLVVRNDSGISQVSDLRGKIVGSLGSHPGLNDWLFLKQHGLNEDKGEVKLRQAVTAGKLEPTDLSVQNQYFSSQPWKDVLNGEIDAIFLNPPADLLAKRDGLKVIKIDYLPMIWFVTVSSGMPFVKKHPDIVERFLKGTIEGIAFFKKQKKEAVQIIQEQYTLEGKLDEEAATHLHSELSQILEPKLYPSLPAIMNVYEEAIQQDKLAKHAEPMALWDMHFLRIIDDSGFVNKLYS